MNENNKKYKLLVALRRELVHNSLSSTLDGCRHYGYCVGPLATIFCQLRQAWKGATVAEDSCAEMWLAWFPPKSYIPQLSYESSGTRQKMAPP